MSRSQPTDYVPRIRDTNIPPCRHPSVVSKGRHPAGLNFGDCFTYALAERTGHPVLCTGDDFAATDITVVRPRPTPSAGLA
jgi:hypothetical protein